MSLTLAAPPAWTTAALAHDAAPLPLELSALGRHLALCQGRHGRLAGLHCAAEAAHRALAARFVTTLFGIALLVAAVALAA